MTRRSLNKLRKNVRRRLRGKRDFDLATSKGRRGACWDLYASDHGFLRVFWTNRRAIGDQMIRCNQPSPARIRHLASEGIRTIINLRGVSDAGYYLLEREACEAAGVVLEDFRVFSRKPPPPETIHGAAQLFGRIEYPAMMHCKSGADRAGFMAVLYRHFRLGIPIPEALRELSLRAGHIPTGKTGILDHFFHTYLDDVADRPMPLLEWVDKRYDPERMKATFQTRWWGTLLSERLLNRE